MKDLKKLFQISLLKTLRINFFYFPLKTAIKLPILLSRKVNIRSLRGDVVLNCPVRTGILRFGFDTLGIVDYKHERSVWENNGTIELSGITSFGPSSKLVVLGGGKVSIGQNVAFTGAVRIITGEHVIIGDDCAISWDVQIMDTDFHKILDEHGSRSNYPKEINIGDHVWIGCKCLILKGSNIPSGSVVAANTFINMKLEKCNAIYGGNPVKILKQDVIWER